MRRQSAWFQGIDQNVPYTPSLVDRNFWILTPRMPHERCGTAAVLRWPDLEPHIRTAAQDDFPRREKRARGHVGHVAFQGMLVKSKDEWNLVHLFCESTVTWGKIPRM